MDMTDKNSQQMKEIAQALFDAIECGDTDTLLALYADKAVLWTSAAAKTVDARAVAVMLPQLIRKGPQRRYVNRSVDPLPSGFVHRHRIISTLPNGAQAAVECCAIVTLHDGKVCRIDEYLDGRQLAAVLASS